ncbi:MAG: hypothetical protein M3514_10100 [Actinomycetota bacterium]|jgi:hypothetical protein|nr:hypothetical protein [Rubrobacteraceae bacterium]MBA3704055.1 hypothetical protein [Rubrobacteraceae bacterium]MDQ3497841.1 hypothetical protein [Actinomycetota bacterium]
MSRSERVYRMLLLAYPRDFRREYGLQMEQAFGDLYREACERGGRSTIALLWALTITDLARTAVAQRITPRADHEEVAMYDRRLAVVGFLLLLAPLYFVSASLLEYGLGVGFLFDPLEAFLSVAERRIVFNVVSPFVFLGGLCLALALNTYAVARLNFRREEETMVSIVRLKLKSSNIAVAVISILLLATLVGYVFLENFTHR